MTMTMSQKILKALVDAAGQHVPSSRLREIGGSRDPRFPKQHIYDLRKAGFAIRTRYKKDGPCEYRLEAAEGEERDRALAYVSEALPELGGVSIFAFLKNLRREITRVRAENKCQRDRQRWNPREQHVDQLISLLDFVEAELDKIAKPITPARRETTPGLTLDNAATIDSGRVAKELQHEHP